MTYINKKTRLFLGRGDVKLERRRSEARLKTYPSAIDVRAWCDIVEDRRQHILELIYKGREKCLGRLIPIEAIINALSGQKIADNQKLQRCLAQLWKFLEGANLNEEDREKLAALKLKMDPVCTGGAERGEGLKEKLSDECVAKARHERELAEIEALTKSAENIGTYKVTTKGPARITTRIKGIRPGFQVAPRTSGGTIATRAQGPARVRTTVKNAFPNLRDNEPKREGIPKMVSESQPEEQNQPHIQTRSITQTPEEGSKSTSPQLEHDKQPTTQARTYQIKTPVQPAHQTQPMTPAYSNDQKPVSTLLQSSHQTQPMTPAYSNDQKPVSTLLQSSHQTQPITPAQPSYQTHPVTPVQSIGQKPVITPSQMTDQSRPISQSQSRQRPEEPSLHSQPVRGALPDLKPMKPAMSANQSHTLSENQVTFNRDDNKIPEPLLNVTTYEEETDRFSSVLTGSGITDIPGKPEDLSIKLDATEALCNELKTTLEGIKAERDDFKNKFEITSEELATIKKLHAASPIIPTSCKEEIEALELEIKVMRSGNLSPDQEAEVIKKEVEVLKKYCTKLKSVEDENEKLRIERDTLKSQVNIPGDAGQQRGKIAKDNLNRQVAGTDKRKSSSKVGSKDKMETESKEDTSKTSLGSKDNLEYVDELNGKLKYLEEITKERDMLANKVQRLEKELLQYRDLPEDLDVYRNRSKMLDSALEERDKMSKKVEQIKGIEDELNQLRKRSSRMEELEEELKTYSKNDKNIGSELKKINSRCTCLEKELQNVKMERDSMCCRIECMKREIETLRAKAKEAEMYKLERDKLQIRLNELAHIQVQYENLMLKCKNLENAATERDMYKQKYEEIVASECRGDARSQIETTKNLERERNSLVKQVGDLESCICDQEEEIKKLVMQIDHLCRNKDDNQCRMKEALCSMRAEIEKKDCLIAESEQKLAAVQTQLKSSIQGVSCETICYKTRIEDLERELKHSQTQVEILQKRINEKGICIKGIEKLTKNECESVAAMKQELEAAKFENMKLREIANKMVNVTGDEHVQNMLKQSQCAVKRVVEELGRQYKEWDNLKRNQKKGIYAEVNKHCPCKNKNMNSRQLADTESNEKLLQELEDIQREKLKLEQLVKQIQNVNVLDSPQNELISLRVDNAKLQEELEQEVKKRKDLEKRYKI